MIEAMLNGFALVYIRPDISTDIDKVINQF